MKSGPFRTLLGDDAWRAEIETADRAAAAAFGLANAGANGSPDVQAAHAVVRVAGPLDLEAARALSSHLDGQAGETSAPMLLEWRAPEAQAAARSADAHATRDLLLPRSTAVVQTRATAQRLLGEWRTAGDDAVRSGATPACHGNPVVDGPDTADPAFQIGLHAAPALARQLRALGATAVCLLDDDADNAPTAAREPDRSAPARTQPTAPAVWLDTPDASGWMTAALPTAAAALPFITRFSSALAAALARGFVVADAAVLALMASTPSSSAPLQGDTGLGANPSFVHDPGRLPALTWGDVPRSASTTPPQRRTADPRRLDLYAIVDRADRIPAVLQAGVRTVQLRLKAPPAPDAAWARLLADEVRRSIAACAAAGAELFINDHWRAAREHGAHGVHLGQEDLLALGEAGRAELAASGLALGISSHSLWELCRARVLAPRYIACGPVWPTLTKAMPWQPQGLDNLAWWCRMAGAPVVAIGGILEPAQAREAARAGADGICIVRAIGADPELTVPTFRTALQVGRAESARFAESDDAWPHPTLRPEPVRPSSRA